MPSVLGRQKLSGVRPVLLFLPLVLLVSGVSRGQEQSEAADDVTGTYQFLTADDTLGLLDEEGILKGYIDVFQGEEESDAILSYPLLSGSHKKNQVEFRTAKIHQKYYRFSGTVERGTGHEGRDPDYLRLVGDLEIVTVNSETGKESTERRHVIFKSRGNEGERGQ
ncbi:MAG: hypothetical protein LAN62_00275 [Acidobacteriia bacterium]|nr:hypothetical protein [Terriglobia bacterium]